MINRYSRQVLFEHIGETGQQKFAESSVFIVGCGALGTALAEMLCRAGIGKLTIVDRDYVEWSNLQRQSLFSESDAIERLPKVVAAKKRLSEVNASVQIDCHILDGTASSLAPFVKEADVIVDATDNFETRLVINDLAMKYDKPWIYGACVGSTGMSYTVRPHVTACFHCLLGEIPFGTPTCDTRGIIAPAVQQVVSHQVTEVFKLLLNDTESLRPGLITFDLWTNRNHLFKVENLKKPACPSCGEKPTYPYLSYSGQSKTEVLCGRDAVQIKPKAKLDRALESLVETFPKELVKQVNPYLLVLEIDSFRIVLFQDGRAIVHGTKSIEQAKMIYQRWIGG